MHFSTRILTSVSALVFSAFTAHAQAPTVQWAKCYGGSEHDYAGSIHQLPDNSYTICGRVGSIDGDITVSKGGDDAWLARLNDTGKVMTQRNYGGTSYDAADHGMPTFDGGYVLVGYTTSIDGDVTGLHGTGTSSDIWIAKLSSTGTIDWQKCIGGFDNDNMPVVAQTADSGFILAGSVYSNDGDVSNYKGNGDAFVVRLDKTGSIVWKKTLGGAEGDIFKGVTQTADGGYILTGSTNSTDGDLNGLRSSTADFDLWVVKMDAGGTIAWQKLYGGPSDEEGQQIKQTADGGYIIAGYTMSATGDVTSNHGGTDCWVLKLGSTGALSWQKTYGGSAEDIALDIITATDGGYVFCGRSRSADKDLTTNKGFVDAWIVKITSAGNLSWQQSFGGISGDYATSITKTNDGGYAVLASSSSHDGDVTNNHGPFNNRTDLWLIKLSKEPTGVPAIANNASVKLYPTCTGRYVQLQAGDAHSISRISVINTLGQYVKTCKPYATQYQLDMDGLAAGNYFVQIVLDDNTTETGRVTYIK